MARFARLLVIAASLLLASFTFSASKLDGIIPLTLRVPVYAVYAGDPVTFRVTFDGPAVGNETVYINSPTSSFSSLPPSVTPQAGYGYVDVNGTLSMNPGPVAELEATIGQVTVEGEINISQ